jgi:hypothetical protein
MARQARHAVLALLEPFHDAAECPQAVVAAARHERDVDLLLGLGRLQDVGIDRPRPAAADVCAADRLPGCPDDGDASLVVAVRALVMADEDALDVGDRVVRPMPACLLCGGDTRPGDARDRERHEQRCPMRHRHCFRVGCVQG